MGAQERKGHLKVLSQAVSGFTQKRPLHSNMERLVTERPHSAQTATLKHDTLISKGQS